jgi:hypothetical protein
MIAWHGSPMLFDAFEAEKIGSQWRHGGAEGFGIYLTDNRDIAGSYATPGWQDEQARELKTAQIYDNSGMVARPGHPQGWRGYVYEIEAPDGPFIDNDLLCSEQDQPARSIFEQGFAELKGPQYRYWKHVLATAPENKHYYSQVGKLLSFCRKSGTPLEDRLVAAGYVGCKKRVRDWGGSNEFAIFDPSVLRIVSVSAFRRGEFFPMEAHPPFGHAWLEAAQ